MWGSGDRRVLDTAISPTGRQLKLSNASDGRCHDDEKLKVHSFSNAANTPSSPKIANVSEPEWRSVPQCRRGKKRDRTRWQNRRRSDDVTGVAFVDTPTPRPASSKQSSY